MPPKKPAPKNAPPSASAASTDHRPYTSDTKDGPQLIWSGELNTVNSVPGRCHHAAALFDGKLWIVGGWVGGPRSAQHATQIHCLDFATTSWNECETTGEPHPGSSQAAVVDVGQALLFVGGWTGTCRTNAVTLLQFESAQWAPFKKVDPNEKHNPEEVKLPPLTFHTANFVGNKKVYVLGGNTMEGQNAEGYCLDTQTQQWTIVQSLGAQNLKRSSHTATLVHETLLVVIGGRGGPDGTTILNDVAILDTSSNHWLLGSKVEGAPPARYGHSACAIGSNIIVFGGVGENGQLLNDVWILNCENRAVMSWSKAACAGPEPSPRAGHACVEMMSNMYIIGGRTDAFGRVTSDVVVMDTSAVSPVQLAMEGTGGEGDDRMSDRPTATPMTDNGY